MRSKKSNRRKATRIERDSLGEKEVPADAYYGVQTARALENFRASGLRLPGSMVRAYAMIKKAAALANEELRMLDSRRARAIVWACDEVLSGKHDDQFRLDAYQAGAGTSFNMNVNEVLANLALERLGRTRGDYEYLSPNDHVNMAQSTNDTFPTAMHVAALLELPALDAALGTLASALREKATQFRKIIKSGRTHLQDAVPITLGQEFGAMAEAIAVARSELIRRSALLNDIALGGTAVGTGLNAHPGFSRVVARHLSNVTGLKLKPTRNLIYAVQCRYAVAAMSGALRDLALELIRIANDLRLLSSGPTTGIAEIALPAVQPGSSIMPGKVNPVMAECLDMIGFQVVGNDLAVALAVQAGQFDLNVMMPLMALNMIQSIRLLSNYLPDFTERCVRGITADSERCLHYFERSVGLATALSPRVGYLKAAEIAHESIRSGESIKALAIRKGIVTEKEFDRITDPLTVALPKKKKKGKGEKRK
ncbi:MAG: aspartate ammonia-lyase [Candidatus Abyssubacteria bacterium]